MPSTVAGAPYMVSPATGWPMLERWTRIWWVRPVPILTESREEPGAGRETGFRPGSASLGTARGHAGAVHRVAGDGAVDAAALGFDLAMDERGVNFFDLAVG